MTDLELGSAPATPSLARRLRSTPLAAVLSVALVLFWIAYLVVAPTPAPSPPLQPQRAPTAGALPQLPDQIRILLWRDILGADVLTAFESESGVKVIVERYDTLQDLMAIMNGGRLTHDVVIASGVGVPLMIERALLQPLPQDQLLRTAGLDQAILTRAAQYDAGNVHSLPILWGTTGLAFDRVKIAERFKAGEEIESWSSLFDPALAKTLADCGIQIINAPDGVFPVALTYLNLPHDSVAVEDTDAAARLWEGVRSSILKFATADIVGGLARGDICFAMATSGDSYQASARSRTLGAPRDIAYVLPLEGAVLWQALAVVPAAARYPGHAAALMNYLMRPEVGARMTNTTGFISAVKDAGLYVKPEIKNDPALNPDLDSLPSIVLEKSPGSVGVELRNKFWQIINASPEQAPVAN